MFHMLGTYDTVGSRFSDRAHYNEFCRKWVQKLGSDGATACFRGEKYTESDGPTSQGERTPRPRMFLGLRHGWSSLGPP